jgi:hypothetical protein
MASDFLGVRLNPKKHKEIIDWLAKFKEKERSDEVRRLLLLGIRVSKGEKSTSPPPQPSRKLEPISWKLPIEPTVKKPEPPKRCNVVMNILGSFRE